MINYKSRRFWLTIVSIIIVLGLVFVGFKLFLFQKALSSLPASDTPVVFVEGGVAHAYRIDDGALVRSVVDLGDGIMVLESVPSPVDAEESIVLASVPGRVGTVAAVRHANNDLTLLVAGDTNKADLSVRSDGVVVFSTTLASEESETTGTPVDEVSDDNGVEEEGFATGPVAGAPVALPSAMPQLVSVNLHTSAIKSLGQGYSPRLASDGSVTALASEGVVRIDPVTHMRSVILAYQSPVGAQGRISPSGKTVALPGGNGSIEFYDLTGAPHYTGYLETEGGITQAALVDDEHLFVRVGTGIAHYYNLPTDDLPIATPIAILSIIQ